MSTDFTSIHNLHEAAVFAAVAEAAPRFVNMAQQPELLPDVACVALNRLAPRYIRHEIDYSFYALDAEREQQDRLIAESVDYAFHFVQARVAMRARA